MDALYIAHEKIISSEEQGDLTKVVLENEDGSQRTITVTTKLFPYLVTEKFRPLLNELVSRDVKIKYRRSVLEVLWTLLNPLFMMIVLS